MIAQETLLVTGASGRLSRSILNHLREIRGDRRLLAGTRCPSVVTPMAEMGIEVRHLDFDDCVSVEAAFAGVQQLLLVCPLRFASLFHLRNRLYNVVMAAELTGVQRVVFISSAHPEGGSPMILADIHCAVEHALARSRMRWTSLRMNCFTDLLWETVVCQALSGSFVAAAGEGGAAFVTQEDAARTAAHALVRADIGQAVLEVTGPSVETFTQVAEAVSEFTSQKMAYLRATPAAARARLISSAGFTTQAADLLISYQQAIQAGRYAPASTVVQDLTGRAPTSVREFIAERRRAWMDDCTELALSPPRTPTK